MGRKVIRGRMPLPRNRVCVECMCGFTALRSDAMTCSGKCRVAYCRRLQKVTAFHQEQAKKQAKKGRKREGKK